MYQVCRKASGSCGSTSVMRQNAPSSNSTASHLTALANPSLSSSLTHRVPADTTTITTTTWTTTISRCRAHQWQPICRLPGDSWARYITRLTAFGASTWFILYHYRRRARTRRFSHRQQGPLRGSSFLLRCFELLKVNPIKLPYTTHVDRMIGPIAASAFNWLGLVIFIFDLLTSK